MDGNTTHWIVPLLTHLICFLIGYALGTGDNGRGGGMA